MFTGLVADKGTVRRVEPDGSGARIEVETALADELGEGDSVAVNGVCLTAVATGRGAFRADVMAETLRRSSLGPLGEGDSVNLELSLRASDRLGGHMVQGHVDGTAEVVDRRDLEEHRVLAFSIPLELAPFLVEKGSVTVDGVSLTVSALLPDRFEVALIPHTLEMTTLALRVPGDRVNLEMDVIGKYVHRILAARGLVPSLRGESA